MSEDRNQPLFKVTAPADARFAIVWSRFNQHVVGKLLHGARGCFSEHGVATPPSTSRRCPAHGSFRTPRSDSPRASASTP